MRDDLRREFVEELARVYGTEDAGMIIAELRIPPRLRPGAHVAAAPFWDRLVQRIEDGALDAGGVELLEQIAARDFPRNPVFLAVRTERETERVQPENPLPPIETFEQTAAPPVAEAAPPPAQETGQYPTLRFIVRDDEELDPAPGPLLAAAREVVGPGAQLLYTTYGQVAIEIPAAAADRLDDVAAAVQHALPPGRDIDVQFQRYDHRPHLLDLVFAEGPDHQRFELTGIPTVTTVRELANAIMDQYDEDVFRDTGTGHRRRVTVDHLPQQEGTQPRRLDPEATVHAEGIQDGDGVRLLPEVTAGAPPRQRQIAVARAGAAIRKFANDNDGFRLIAALPEDLPFNFEVELTAPGFGPPLDGEFEPVDRDVHRVVITLHSEFPIQAPYVTFLTPVFHPNIRAGGNHNGAVCLGVLLEQYTPGLDFTELCLILLDLAAYRNYETGHFLNGAAAEWARSPEGITRILARGGLALAPANATADELPEEKSSIRLAVRPLDRKP